MGQVFGSPRITVYGTYGLSVFAARGITVEELAQRLPLVRFEILTLVLAGVLRAAGFRLEATGRNPQHFTVALRRTGLRGRPAPTLRTPPVGQPVP